MTQPKILIQLDPDNHASVFDSVVALDSGVDQLLRHDHVEPTQVRDLVHGAIFTRGPAELKSTAIFIGGTQVADGEALLDQVKHAFFGPMRVSVLLDSNGANTTAAAAVLAANRHLDLAQSQALVLGGTGPVGRRVARLLARCGASVRLTSRSRARAEEVCEQLAQQFPQAKLQGMEAHSEEACHEALREVDLLIAAGAAGVQLMPQHLWTQASQLSVAIDLNAVPPVGLEGIDPLDKARSIGSVTCYGAIGVGGLKMKIHKQAIRQLFTTNDLVLDAEEVFDLGKSLA